MKYFPIFVPSHRHLGSALSEYGIILAGIAVVALGGLVLLGNSLSGALRWMNDGFQGQMAASSRIQEADASGQPENRALTGRSVATSWLLTTENGTQLYLENYPANIQKAVETSGANGTKDQLAAKIRQIADQLLEKGEITTEQADLMVQLSNQGHRIASMERIIEDAARQSGGSNDTFRNLAVEWEGRRYPNGQVLSHYLGWSSADKSAHGLETQKFIELRNTVLQSGMLRSPATQRSVQILAEHVINIANGVETSTAAVLDGHVRPSEVARYTAEYMDERYRRGGSTILVDSVVPGSPSEMTHQDFSQICGHGDHRDSGTHCRFAR